MQAGAIVNGHYEILDRIGQGEYGITYAALDRTTGLKCAIKCLSLASQVEIPTVERFRNEAKLLKNLTHPGIPRFLEFFTIEEQRDTKLFLVRELVEGNNLRELIDEGRRFTEREAILLAIGILDILVYLHDFSPPVIHKDIKPENIVLGENGTAHLVDFNFIGDGALTADGSLIGRYGYVSPDQLGKEAGPTSDIYSLAMTIFFILSRKDPAAVKRTASGRFAYGALVNISPPFLAVLEKMSSPVAADRYPSAREARDALQALLAPPKRTHRLLLVLAASLLVAGLGYALLPGKRIVPLQSAAPAPLMPIPAPQKREPAPATSTFQSDAPPVIHIGFDGSLEGTGVRFTQPRGQTESTAFIPGARGQAKEFPGSLEYVQEAERTFPDSYTLSFWFKVEDDFTAFPGNLSILRTGMLTFDARGAGRTILFVHFSGGGHFNTDVSTAGSPFRAGKWHHIAFVKDHLRGSFLVYRDGIAIDRRPLRYNEYVLANILDVLKFGKEYGTADRACTYGLDEFEVYDYARSSEQIARDAGLLQPSTGQAGQVQTAEEGAFTLSGRLLHDGGPLAEFTNAVPSFWFRNEITGKEAREVRATWEADAFRFTGFQPGRYGVQVWVNAERENPNGYPGDYETWHTFIVQEGGAGLLDIEVMKVMRLTSPQDNWSGMTRWTASCEGKHSYTSPVLFAWEPMGPGVEYRYAVDNRAETTSGTAVSIEFSPMERGRCHSFRLTAVRNGRTIGRMLTHGINGGLGWDYVFRVD